MTAWYRIWKRRREREDFAAWTSLVGTPDTNVSFDPGDTDTLELPAPATIMLRCDGDVDAASFRVETLDGTVAFNREAVTNEAVVLGTFEEGETLTIEHVVGSTFSGEMEIGVRDPAGRFRTVFVFTCP